MKMQINKCLLIDKDNISIEINKNKRRKLYKYSMNWNQVGGISKNYRKGTNPFRYWRIVYLCSLSHCIAT